jgi:hypothetical protein
MFRCILSHVATGVMPMWSSPASARGAWWMVMSSLLLFVLPWSEPRRGSGELRQVLNNLAGLGPLSLLPSYLDGRDGLEAEMEQLRARSSLSWPWSSSFCADYTVIFDIAAILGQKGGPSSTSNAEALARIQRRSSTPPGGQVVRPRVLGGGRCVDCFAGVEFSSYLLSELGGIASSSPATGGRGAQVLDCVFSFLSRVLCVNVVTLFSNHRSFTRNVKGHHSSCTCHVFP